MERLYSFIEARYLQLKTLKFTKVDSDYEKVLFRFNQWNKFKDERGILFSARIIGTSKEGKLILEKENGDKTEYGIKEFSFVI